MNSVIKTLHYNEILILLNAFEVYSKICITICFHPLFMNKLFIYSNCSDLSETFMGGPNNSPILGPERRPHNNKTI